MASVALFTLLTTVIVNVLLVLIVVSRTYQKRYGLFFGLTILGVISWALADIVLLFTDNAAILHVAALIFYIAPMMIPIFIWFFALSFPENTKPPLWTVLLALAVYTGFASLFVFDLEIFVVEIATNSTLNSPQPNPLGFLAYSSYFSLFFILTYYTFYTKMRRLKGIKRTQITYTFIGALLASVPALISNLTLPMLGYGSIIWLGPFFTLVFAASVTVAIVRVRLFNIRLVVARSVGYILSVVSVAVLYGFAAFSLVRVFVLPNASADVGSQVIYAVLAALLAFAFSPIRRFFDKLTNRWFYRDAYDPQDFLDELNRSLVASINLQHVLEESSRIIQDNLRAEFCVFEDTRKRSRLGGEAKQGEAMQQAVNLRRQRLVVTDALDHSAGQAKLATLLAQENIAMVAKLGQSNKAGEPLFYLYIGNRKSGDPYTTNDIKVMDIVINELLIAIQNALRFEEIQNFNKTLQARVEEATIQLREQNKRLKMLDRTKDDFISMASHQLRTPLTAVKGYVSMVLEGDAGKITALQRRLLSQSFISAQRMVYLISDLLNVSRLRTGKFELEKSPVSLIDVIKTEVEQLQEAAASRSLQLRFEPPQSLPPYMLDDIKLRQVIMNFIDNAIYYTQPNGSILVKLKDKPDSIEFTVTDTGIGVPKRDQPHMFTKYFRAHNAQVARPDGTGLGLFMAKKVIMAHGGAVIFKSKEHAGSTFGFTIPKRALELAQVKRLSPAMRVRGS